MPRRRPPAPEPPPAPLFAAARPSADGADPAALAAHHARGLAVVQRVRGVHRVILPPAHAEATVAAWLETWGLYVVISTTIGARPLPPDTWAIGVISRQAHILERILRGPRGALPELKGGTPSGWLWVEQPLNELWVDPGLSAQLQQALHRTVAPDPDEGLPEAWVPVSPPTARLDEGRAREDDVELIASDEPTPPSPPGARALEPADPRDDAWVVAVVQAACARAGLPAPPVELRRPELPQGGFVGGRVALTRAGPLRITLELCPNADAAEVWATVLHEVAHAVRKDAGHRAPFQAAMLDLAGAFVGEAALAEARRRVGGPSADVDAWLALSLRAAFAAEPPPQPEAGDDGQLARVVGRIQKLRALAARHPGTPEAVSAAAVANGLLVRWGLGAYQVRLDARIDEQMVDRWLDVGKSAIWRRQLAFLVAEHFDAFALSRADRGWMHLFGRFADVVTAEYFYEVWRDHIEREADAHLERWRAGSSGRAHARSERTDFCDNAVIGLRQKLKALKPAEAGADAPLARATAFAAAEHGLRGTSWSTGTGKSVHANAEGQAAGARAPMGRGVGAAGGPRGLLKG